MTDKQINGKPVVKRILGRELTSGIQSHPKELITTVSDTSKITLLYEDFILYSSFNKIATKIV